MKSKYVYKLEYIQITLFYSYEDPLEGVFVGEVTDIAVRMLCDVDFSF